MECVLCSVVEPIEKMTHKFAEQIFVAVSVHAINIFECLIGLWFIFQVVYKGLIKAELNLKCIIAKCFLFSLIFSILKNTSWFWEWFYHPVNEVVNKMMFLIINVSGQKIRVGSGQMGMIEVIDATSKQIFELSKIFFSGGLFDIGKKIAGIPIVFMYVFLFAIFVTYNLDYLLKMLLITAISPLLIIAIAFSNTVGFAINAIKILCHGILNLLFSIIIMVLTLFAVEEIFNKMPINDMALKETAGTWIFSKDYWACFMLAVVSIMFQLKISSISSALINVSGLNKTWERYFQNNK